MEQVKIRVELSDEYRTKLQGALGFNVSAEFTYVPKKFRESTVPKDFWPVFSLTSKDGLEVCNMEDGVGEIVVDDVSHKSSMKINTGSQRVKTLEIGIKTIKRYPLENGDLLYFDGKEETITVAGKTSSGTVRDVIRFLSPGIQVDLQNAINERKLLTPEELTGLEL